MPSPFPSTRAKARPPQPRESNHALHPNTGPGAEGGGGWPLPTGALPCPQGSGRTGQPKAPSGTARRAELRRALNTSSAYSRKQPLQSIRSRVLVHRLACSIDQLPCKQLLDAQSLSDEPRGPWKPQSFSHSFSHSRQPDAGQQSQQRILAFATRAFKAAGRWFESNRGRDIRESRIRRRFPWPRPGSRGWTGEWPEPPEPAVPSKVSDHRCIQSLLRRRQRRDRHRIRALCWKADAR